MNKILNRSGILWALGVIQPASPLELSGYLATLLGDNGSTPSGAYLHGLLMDLAKSGHIIRVHRDPDLFSLSYLGNFYLSDRQRRTRDASRLFLLKDAARDRAYMPRTGGAQGLGDDTSPLTQRRSLEGTESNTVGLSVPQVRPYWPRYSKQFSSETGLSSPLRGNFLPLLSFASETQLRLGRQSEASARYDYASLGLMLGISPRLIHNIVYNKHKNYREFTLPKRGGGDRIISSPRVFLKIIQKFVSDYILSSIETDDAVHSFRRGRSIVSNARIHESSNYVASIDIVDFFGSITAEIVNNSLIRNGLDRGSSAIISEITTLDGSLPQGSPASPAISNFVIRSFDKDIYEFCKSRKLNYSRYADDISISGAEREIVLDAISYATKKLRNDFGLYTNDKKTRIVSNRSQQVVTGVVVNYRAQPNREFRRNTRAAIDKLQKSSTPDPKSLEKIRGRVSYLMSFPHLRNSTHITEMKMTLDQIAARWARKLSA